MGRPKLYTDEELREHERAYNERRRQTEAYQEAQRKYRQSAKRRAISLKHWRKLKNEQPLRYKAYNAVRWAVRSGKLIKPDACEQCGRVVRISAHHHNGYEPEHRLDVRWLCRACHVEAHRLEEAA